MDKNPKTSAPAGWTWTPQRRLALRLMIEGATQAEIAKRVHVHRHTVKNWTAAPEWAAELRTRMGERVMSARFRRVHATEKITDRLAKLAGDALEAERIQVGSAGLLLRELREYQRLEREHLGMSHTEPATVGPGIAIHLNAPPLLEPTRDRISDRSFRDFVRDHIADVSPEALAADTPQMALILATTDILQANPDLLTALQDEYSEEAHAADVRRESEKRRR